MSSSFFPILGPVLMKKNGFPKALIQTQTQRTQKIDTHKHMKTIYDVAVFVYMTNWNTPNSQTLTLLLGGYSEILTLPPPLLRVAVSQILNGGIMALHPFDVASL